MRSSFFLLLAASFALMLSACAFKYGTATRGFGYPAGLSSLAPRLGNQGNFIYYPRYEAYYHPSTQQFYYPNGKTWAVQPTVLKSSAQEVRSTPAIPFQLEGHPSKYHVHIKQAFPSDWTPGKGRFEEPYEFGRSGWDIDRR